LAQEQRQAIDADAVNRDALLQAISAAEQAKLDELIGRDTANMESLLVGWRDLQQIAQQAEAQAEERLLAGLAEIRAAIQEERERIAGQIAVSEAAIVMALHELALSRPGVSAQHGIDYIPADNFPVRAHRGEAVITARGNEAIGRIEAMLRSGGGQAPTNITIQPAPVVIDGRQIGEITFQLIKQHGEAGRKIVPHRAVY